jgi:hypothetical protein
LIALEFLQAQSLKDENVLPLFPTLPPASCLPIAKWLAVIQHTELFVEIFAKKRWGEKGGWIAAFAVELVK